MPLLSRVYLLIFVLRSIHWRLLILEVICGSLVLLQLDSLVVVEKVYSDYKIIVNGVVILIGLFLCFLGKKTVKVLFL